MTTLDQETRRGELGIPDRIYSSTTKAQRGVRVWARERVKG